MPGTRLDAAESRHQGRCSPGRASLSGQAWVAGHGKALWENRLMTGAWTALCCGVCVCCWCSLSLTPKWLSQVRDVAFYPQSCDLTSPPPSTHTHTHTHTHTYTLNVEISQARNVEISQALNSVLPPTYFPLSPPPDTGGCWIWPLYWAQGQLLLLPSLPSGVIVWVCVSGVDVCKQWGSASIGVWPQSVCSPHDRALR